jgi:hypothetical protein
VRAAKNVRHSGRGVWPTVSFAAIIVLVFGGLVLLRILPHPKSRVLEQPEREALDDLRLRLGQLDQLQDRVGELEERVDFAERLLTNQRESERPGLPKN